MQHLYKRTRGVGLVGLPTPKSARALLVGPVYRPEDEIPQESSKDLIFLADLIKLGR